MPDYLAHRSLVDTAALVFAFFAGLTLLSLGAGFATQRALPGRRVFDVPLAKGQMRLELVGNAAFIWIATVCMTAALATGFVRFGEPSLLRGVLTFVGLLFGFQVFYYFLHRAMHLRSLLWIHRWHHQSQVTTPLSAQSVHPVEGLGWMLGYVLLPGLVSWVCPLSFWGYFGYLAFNIFGNIVGHANVEPTARFAATRQAALFASPFVYHALHHARWTGHYTFQAATMDRIFGTEFADWPELYERIASGQPLKSLKERGSAK